MTLDKFLMLDSYNLGKSQTVIEPTPTALNFPELGNPLLFTKLRVPECAPSLLSRPRLNGELSRHQTGAVTLLSTPPGFGKTTLLADWVRRQNNPVAWLTLDEHDNDPVLFWRYLVAAMQIVNPQLGQRSQAALASQLGTSLETVATFLVNDIVTLIEPDRLLVLVLDDFHWIRNASIQKSVNYLLQHQPQQLHMIFLTRADPTLSLARLRVEGRLQELRATDLRLTPDETGAFLARIVPHDISPAILEILVQQTDGWAAGVQLVALSLRQAGLENMERVVKTLATARHHIFAFLLEEVLSHQSLEIRQFLQETAVMNRFSAPLCSAVTGNADAGALLHHLVDDNLFISPLDDEGKWFSYHPLFAEMLRTNLTEDARRDCLRRAARWYAAQDLVQDAIQSAMEAEDYELMADILTRRYKSILAQGLLVSLQKWLAVLPKEILSPRLQLAGLWSRVYEIGGQEVEELVASIRAAATEMDADLQGEILAVQAIYASLYGSSEQAIELATQAVSLIDPHNYLSLAAAHQAVGNARRNLGELVAAIQGYRAAAKHFEGLGSVFMSQLPLYRIADIQVEQGRLHQALQTYQDVRRIAQEAGREPVIVTGQIYGHLSELYREWNELDQALAYAEQEIELARAGHLLLALVKGHVELAATWAALDDMDAARESLVQARNTAEQLESQPVCAHVAMQEAHHKLFHGDLGAAITWANTYAAERADNRTPLTPLHRDEADVLLARIRLRQGWVAEALDLLQTAAVTCDRSGRVRLLVEIHILEAMAHSVRGNDAKAQQATVQALTLAWQEGYIRVFIENGPTLAPLLLTARHLFPDFVNQLLRLLPAGASRVGQDSDWLDALTVRELEILRLIAQGQTNRQIADSLFITVGTVKGHVNHIFSKLDVSNRTQALVRAQELQLLDSQPVS